MSTRLLRVSCGIGAAILFVGVALIVIGAVSWYPLESAPAGWWNVTTAVMATGFAVTMPATLTLAARARGR